MTGTRQTSRSSPPCLPFSLPYLPSSYYPFSGEDFNPNPKPHLTLLSLYLEVPDWLLGSLACFTTAVSFLVTSLAHLPSTYVFSRWLCHIISLATLVSCLTSSVMLCSFCSCLGLAFPMVSSVARSLLSKQVRSLWKAYT